MSTKKTEAGMSFFWDGISLEQKIALKIVKLTCAKQNVSDQDQASIFQKIKAKPALLQPVLDQLSALKAICDDELLSFAQIAGPLNDQLEIPEGTVSDYQEIYLRGFYQLFDQAFEVELKKTFFSFSSDSSASITSKLAEADRDKRWQAWKNDQITNVYCLHLGLADQSQEERIAQRILKQFILEQRKQAVTFPKASSGEPVSLAAKAGVVAGKVVAAVKATITTENPQHQSAALLSSHAELVTNLAAVITELRDIVGEELISFPAVASSNAATFADQLVSAPGQQVSWSKLYTLIRPNLVIAANGSISCTAVSEQHRATWAKWAIAEKQTQAASDQRLAQHAERQNALPLVSRAALDMTLSYWEKDAYWLGDGDIESALGIVLGENVYGAAVHKGSWTPESFADAFNRQLGAARDALDKLKQEKAQAGALTEVIDLKPYTYYVWVNIADSEHRAKTGGDGSHWVLVKFTAKFTVNVPKDAKGDHTQQRIDVTKTQIEATCYDSGGNSKSATAKILNELLNNKQKLQNTDQQHNQNTYRDYISVPNDNIKIESPASSDYPAQVSYWECGFRTIITILRDHWASLEPQQQKQFTDGLQQRAPMFANAVLNLIRRPVSEQVDSATALSCIRGLVLACTQFTEDKLPSRNTAGLSEGNKQKSKEQVKQKFVFNPETQTYTLKQDVIQNFLTRTLPKPEPKGWLPFGGGHKAKGSTFVRNLKSPAKPAVHNGSSVQVLTEPARLAQAQAAQAQKVQDQLKTWRAKVKNHVHEFCKNKTEHTTATGGITARVMRVPVDDLFSLQDQTLRAEFSKLPEAEKIIAQKAILYRLGEELVQQEVTSLVLQLSEPLKAELKNYLPVCLESNSFLRKVEYQLLPKPVSAVMSVLSGGQKPASKPELPNVLQSEQAKADFQKFYATYCADPVVRAQVQEQLRKQKVGVNDIQQAEIALQKIKFSYANGNVPLNWDDPAIQRKYETNFNVLALKSAFATQLELALAFDAELMVMSAKEQMELLKTCVEDYSKHPEVQKQVELHIKEEKFALKDIVSGANALLKKLIPMHDWDDPAVATDYAAHPRVLALKRAFDQQLMKQVRGTFDIEKIKEFAEAIAAEIKKQTSDPATLSIDFPQLYKAVSGDNATDLTYIQKRTIVHLFSRQLHDALADAQKKVTLDLTDALNAIEQARKNLDQTGGAVAVPIEQQQHAEEDIKERKNILAHFLNQWIEQQRPTYQTALSAYLDTLEMLQNPYKFEQPIDIYTVFAQAAGCSRGITGGFLYQDQAFILELLHQELARRDIKAIEVKQGFVDLNPRLQKHFISLLRQNRVLDVCTVAVGKPSEKAATLQNSMTAAIAERKNKEVAAIEERKNKEADFNAAMASRELDSIMARNAFLADYGMDPKALQQTKRNPWDVVIQLLQHEQSDYRQDSGWHFHLFSAVRAAAATAGEDEAQHAERQRAINRQDLVKAMLPQLLPKLLGQFAQSGVSPYQVFWLNVEDASADGNDRLLLKPSNIATFTAQINKLPFTEINLDISVDNAQAITQLFGQINHQTGLLTQRGQLDELASKIQQAGGQILCRTIKIRLSGNGLSAATQQELLKAHQAFLTRQTQLGLPTLIDVDYVLPAPAAAAAAAAAPVPVGAAGVPVVSPVQRKSKIKKDTDTLATAVDNGRRAFYARAQIERTNDLTGQFVSPHKVVHTGKASHIPLVVGRTWTHGVAQRTTATAAKSAAAAVVPLNVTENELIDRDTFIERNTSTYKVLASQLDVQAPAPVPGGASLVAAPQIVNGVVPALTPDAAQDGLTTWWDSAIAKVVGANGRITPEANRQLLHYAHALRDGFYPSGTENVPPILPPGFVVTEVKGGTPPAYKVLHFDASRVQPTHHSPLDIRYIVKARAQLVPPPGVETFAGHQLVPDMHDLGQNVKMSKGAIPILNSARGSLLQFIARAASKDWNFVSADYQTLFTQFQFCHLQALFQLLHQRGPGVVISVLDMLKKLFIKQSPEFFAAFTDNFLSRSDNWADFADAESLAALEKLGFLSSDQANWWTQCTTAHMAESGFGHCGDLFSGFNYFIQQYQKITGRTQLPPVDSFENVKNLKVSLRRFLSHLEQLKRDNLLDAYLDYLNTAADKALDLGVQDYGFVKTLAETFTQQKNAATPQSDATTAAVGSTQQPTGQDATAAPVAHPAATATPRPDDAADDEAVAVPTARFDVSSAVETWRLIETTADDTQLDKATLKAAGYSQEKIEAIFGAYATLLNAHPLDAKDIDGALLEVSADKKLFVLAIIASLSYGENYTKDGVLRLITQLAYMQTCTNEQVIALSELFDLETLEYNNGMAKINAFRRLAEVCLKKHAADRPISADKLLTRSDEDLWDAAQNLIEDKHPAVTRRNVWQQFNSDNATAIIKGMRNWTQGAHQLLPYREQKQLLECLYFVISIGSGSRPDDINIRKTGADNVARYPISAARSLKYLTRSEMAEHFATLKARINQRGISPEEKLSAQLVVLALAREALFHSTGEFLANEHILSLIQIIRQGKNCAAEMAKHWENPACVAVLAVLLSLENECVEVVDDSEVRNINAQEYAGFFDRLGITEGAIRYTSTEELAFNLQDPEQYPEGVPQPARIFTNAGSLLLDNTITYQLQVPNNDYVGDDPNDNRMAWIYPLLNDFIDDPEWFGKRTHVSQGDDAENASNYLLRVRSISSAQQKLLAYISPEKMQQWLNAALEAKNLYAHRISTVPDAVDRIHQKNFDGRQYIVDQKNIQLNGVTKTVSVACLVVDGVLSNAELGEGGQQFLHARLERSRRPGQPEFWIAPETMIRSSLSGKEVLAQSFSGQDSNQPQRLTTVLLTESFGSQQNAEEIADEYNVALFKIPTHRSNTAKDKTIAKKNAQEHQQAIIDEVYRGLGDGYNPFAFLPKQTPSRPPQPIVIVCETDAEAAEIYAALADEVDQAFRKNKDSDWGCCNVLQLDTVDPAQRKFMRRSSGGVGAETAATTANPGDSNKSRKQQRGLDAKRALIEKNDEAVNNGEEAGIPGSITVTTRLGLSEICPIANKTLVIQAGLTTAVQTEKNRQLAGAQGHVVQVINNEAHVHDRPRKQQEKLQRFERRLDRRQHAIDAILFRNFSKLMGSDSLDEPQRLRIVRAWNHSLTQLHLQWESILANPDNRLELKHKPAEINSRLLACSEQYAAAAWDHWYMFLSSVQAVEKVDEVAAETELDQLIQSYQARSHKAAATTPVPSEAVSEPKLEASVIDVNKVYVDRMGQVQPNAVTLGVVGAAINEMRMQIISDLKEKLPLGWRSLKNRLEQGTIVDMLGHVHIELREAYQKNVAPVYLPALLKAQQDIFEIMRNHGWKFQGEREDFIKRSKIHYQTLLDLCVQGKIKSEQVAEQKAFLQEFAGENLWFTFNPVPSRENLKAWIVDPLQEYSGKRIGKSDDRKATIANLLKLSSNASAHANKTELEGAALPVVLKKLVEAREQALADDLAAAHDKWALPRNINQSHLHTKLQTLIHRVNLQSKLDDHSAGEIKQWQRRDLSNLIHYLIEHLGPDAKEGDVPGKSKNPRSEKFQKLAEALNALKAELDNPNAENADKSVDAKIAQLQKLMHKHEDYIHHRNWITGFSANVRGLFKMVAERCHDLRDPATMPLNSLFDGYKHMVEEALKQAGQQAGETCEPCDEIQMKGDIMAGRKHLSSGHKKNLDDILENGWEINQQIRKKLAALKGVTDVTSKNPEVVYNAEKKEFMLKLHFNFNKCGEGKELLADLIIDPRKPKTLKFNGDPVENSVSAQPAENYTPPLFQQQSVPQPQQQSGGTATAVQNGNGGQPPQQPVQ